MAEEVIDMEEEVSAESVPEKAPDPSEQRSHERFRVSLKVFIRLSDGSIVHGQAVDLSMGGIYIEYGAPADEGKVFELAFDLPFTDEFKRVLVKARIVRSIVIGSRSLYGLAFVYTEFAKDTDKVLEKYLKLRKTQTA
ncbi:MAG: hypothetical protein DIZ80_16500 [endosymbiont of Galathealinum brachiosum]|uniref:PilZ domain-containing protein n=1 Tax=endosymbiont of Galathealinum brachiosum TaxID=2200906 RepID=A0A370DBV7_9GAMM|nr:MAG: hypothetical protein DIZ80_16500 [endosymbiont of Galathealinum brachiosum]